MLEDKGCDTSVSDSNRAVQIYDDHCEHIERVRGRGEQKPLKA